jgi:hypothetical protein
MQPINDHKYHLKISSAEQKTQSPTYDYDYLSMIASAQLCQTFTKSYDNNAHK